jgi:hypothetical protein
MGESTKRMWKQSGNVAGNGTLGSELDETSWDQSAIGKSELFQDNLNQHFSIEVLPK